jgi:hypothetical protein
MKKISFIALGLASVALVSCSSDEAEGLVSNSNVIKITSALQQTRSTEDPQKTALSTSNTVGVFVSDGASLITNGDNNKHSVASNGDLTASAVMTYPESGDLNIYAYAPYASGTSYAEDNSFSVATDQSEAAAYLASDLLYAKAEGVSKSENAVALTFAHQLSQLQITITNNNSSRDLTNSAVKVCGTKVATSFNPSTGELGAASGNAAEIVATSSLGDNAKVYAVVVPQTVAAGTELVKVVTDDYTYVAKIGSDVVLESGKAYSFNVTLPATEEQPVEISLNTVDVTAWEENNTIDGVDMEERNSNYLYASFDKPASNGNGTWNAATNLYTWKGNNANLVYCFKFSGEECANYETLYFTIAGFDKTVSGAYRLYVYFTDGKGYEKQFANSCIDETVKTVALTDLLSDGYGVKDIASICFGGASNSGSLTLTNMYLVPKTVETADE